MATSNFQDKSGPGGIVWNPASPYAKEMAKWEMGYSPYGPPGRPRENMTDREKEWPKLFYLMKRLVPGSQQAFTRTPDGDFVTVHYKEAHDENEATQFEGEGYREGMVKAIAHIVKYEAEVAQAAAERAYQDRNMSDKAKAEVAKVEASTAQHVAVIPETPIKKARGWPKGKPRAKKTDPVAV